MRSVNWGLRFIREEGTALALRLEGRRNAWALLVY